MIADLIKVWDNKENALALTRAESMATPKIGRSYIMSIADDDLIKKSLEDSLLSDIQQQHIYALLEDVVEISKDLVQFVGLEAALVYTELKNIPSEYLIFAEEIIAKRNSYIAEYKFKKRLFSSLIKAGLITFRKLTDEEIVAILLKKTPQNFPGSSLYCSWCKSSTAILHKHHYPVASKDGGNEVVSICPNCHCEFHYLELVKVYVIARGKYDF